MLIKTIESINIWFYHRLKSLYRDDSYAMPTAISVSILFCAPLFTL